MVKHIFTLVFLVSFMANCDATKKTTATKDNSSLETVDQQPIIGTNWKLSSLEGKTVTPAPNQEENIHFVLLEDGRISGYSGCNTFQGTYTLEGSNQISFSQMLATLVSCEGLEINEHEFMKVFKLADNYTIGDNTLMLHVEKRTPLAVFEAVLF